MASANAEINFIGKKILDSKRILITNEQALIADKEFSNQFVMASLQQYSRQQKQSEKYLDSLEIKKEKIKYEKTIKNIKRNLIKDQETKIQGYDRYFFGYLNEDGEKLILMRFDPHKLKYYSIPGTGESHLDVLTIFVYNIDKNILSLSGWADFKEN